MQITKKQAKAAQDIQERLYKIYVFAKAHDLVVADDIKDIGESLSSIIERIHD